MFVGFGRIITEDSLHVMVYELVTDPEYQGREGGSAVLERLVQKRREAGVRDGQLSCAKEKRRFYERHSFVAPPEEGPGMDVSGVEINFGAYR